jgi:hypothetical protein
LVNLFRTSLFSLNITFVILLMPNSLSTELGYKLEVVILTRDRLAFLKQSLASLLMQRASFPWKLIVSDNSEDTATSNWLLNAHPDITVRRYHSLTPEEHFRAAVANAQCQYLMLFHDDDILLQGCIDHLVTILDSSHSLAAVSCNAFLIQHSMKSSNRMLRYAKKDSVISSANELIRRYLDYWAGGVAPLSPYIYRTSALKLEYIDTTLAGKYSDVTMLLKVLTHGSIYWVSQPLAAYRIHDGQDNACYSSRDKLLLLRTLKREFNLKSNSFLYRAAKADIYRIGFGMSPRNLFAINHKTTPAVKKLLIFVLLIYLQRFFRRPRYALHRLLRVLSFD